ncbi:helix-turn-helix transcriptional regulator [Mesorhizobium sp. GR13]|uniref:helix-turn-helix domain-containing protein n=1 Tax=Mesorhizobium sp. GR13 TaxID=2562308 RepID=UPI0010BFBCA7|nr:helix-turn-helix transcriptional regulator [Mesorhizobium sp. GR13]
MEARQLVGWNLRRLRVAKGLSQDDLAYESKVERAYVGHLERGTKNPTIGLLERLAMTLDCEIQELFLRPPEGSAKPQTLKPGRHQR